MLEVNLLGTGRAFYPKTPVAGFPLHQPSLPRGYLLSLLT